MCKVWKLPSSPVSRPAGAGCCWKNLNATIRRSILPNSTRDLNPPLVLPVLLPGRSAWLSAEDGAASFQHRGGSIRQCWTPAPCCSSEEPFQTLPERLLLMERSQRGELDAIEEILSLFRPVTLSKAKGRRASERASSSFPLLSIATQAPVKLQLRPGLQVAAAIPRRPWTLTGISSR